MSPGRSPWAWLVAVLAALTVAAAYGPLSDRTWEHPQALFGVLVTSSLVCILAATTLVAIADRRDVAEVGLLGTMLLTASIMPMVHGLLTPDVIFDATESFALSAFLTIPVALVAAAPLLFPESRFGRWASRHWRDWTLLALLGVFSIAAALVFFPDAITAPEPHGPLTIGVSAIAAASIALLSARQMYLYGIGRRRSNLVASISLALVGVGALTPMFAEPYSVGFWWAHVAGVLGVLGACGALAVSSRLSPSAHDVLAPILSRDPLVAFELGLSPIVHDFVAELAEKDQITRDHVIRTGELAMRVGERFRLSGTDLRNLGLAAMLHDVGKVHVPDAVLKKPARLTATEYEVMKLHPVHSEEMLASEPTLAAAASIVRSHHERFDGRGYPDGLEGREIPLAARIIAACDALDAMTHDRPYRRAMTLEMAFAVLREHAGSQWDEHVVEQVMAVAVAMPTDGAFDAVGRTGVETEVTIPDDISELLIVIDAEI